MSDEILKPLVVPAEGIGERGWRVCDASNPPPPSPHSRSTSELDPQHHSCPRPSGISQVMSQSQSPLTAGEGQLGGLVIPGSRCGEEWGLLIIRFTVEIGAERTGTAIQHRAPAINPAVSLVSSPAVWFEFAKQASRREGVGLCSPESYIFVWLSLLHSEHSSWQCAFQHTDSYLHIYACSQITHTITKSRPLRCHPNTAASGNDCSSNNETSPKQFLESPFSQCAAA